MGEISVVLVRSAISFVTLLVYSRVLGKTQVAQLSYFEWITGITIGSVVGVLAADLSIRPWPIFVAISAWIALTLVTQGIAIKSRWTAKLIDGEPVVLIQNGQILEENLKSLRMRVTELSSLLRSQGVFDITTVEMALLEPRGVLSILKRSQDRPVTPADLKISTSYEGMAIELVVDGEIMEQNLRRLGVNKAWLYEKLREQGISSPKQAFLAVIDSQGRIYIDRHTDVVPPTDNPSDYAGPN